MKTGIQLIAKERYEQLTKHGYSLKSDRDNKVNNELSQMARLLLDPDVFYEVDIELIPDGWNEDICRKMMLKTYPERLVIAGALIAAEIDRVNGVDEVSIEKHELTAEANMMLSNEITGLLTMGTETDERMESMTQILEIIANEPDEMMDWPGESVRCREIARNELRKFGLYPKNQ